MKKTLVEKILQSNYFEEALQKAVDLSHGGKRRTLLLLKQALLKVSALADQHPNGVLKWLNHYVLLFVDLVKSYVKGEYREVSLKSFVKLLAVLLYFVSPFDFIPDVLPLVGFSDDLALILWFSKAMKQELDAFQAHRSV